MTSSHSEPVGADAPAQRNPHPFLALGFRPFYLLAALFAAAAVPVWIAQLFGVLPQARFVAPIAWHMHEMVFGFACAVIAGFLFTAVRNWTGLPTPEGATLAALAALWLLGRVVMLTGPGPLAAVVDVAFLPAVAWFLWQPLARARNRNRFFVGILLLLAALNAGFHLAHAGIIAAAPVEWIHAALLLVVLVVAIMGGRVIPAFTRNAIPSARVRPVPRLDAIALAMLAVTLAAWFLKLPAAVVATLAFAAALAHALRLACWDSWATRASPILWILHVSYAWIPLGLLLLGLAVAEMIGTVSAALHALGTGAIGGMIIGMITRTARRHTGRPLRVNPLEVTAYVLVHLAAVLRVFVPIAAPEGYGFALITSAALWSAAFALYCAMYWPILTRPRIDGKPG